MNLTLTYFYFNNSICSINNIIKTTTIYYNCQSKNQTLCCLNYTEIDCYSNSNKSYFIDCYKTHNTHITNYKPDRIVIIIFLSFCILLCMLPFFIKCVDCIQYRIIKKKYEKYDVIHTTIINPCYDPESVIGKLAH